jgi:hypothetical protein
MTKAPADQIAKATTDALAGNDKAAKEVAEAATANVAKGSDAAERIAHDNTKAAADIAEAGTASVAKGSDAAARIVRDNTDVMRKSSNGSSAAFEELTVAYQELATRNAKILTAGMQALAAVKSPTEFIELQQRLIKDSLKAAVQDSQHIAQLTAAVFTAAFQPVKDRIEAVQKRVVS